MRTFARGRLARGVAHLLTVVFFWSVVLSGAAAVPAAAQISTRAAASQTVAVVPFANLTGLRPDTLGEEAGDAVAVELRNRLLLDVLPKADVDLQMRDLGLTAPLSDVDLIRLAAELDVPLVITGQVRGARVARSAQGRYAEIVLAVRLFDRVARADVNGALVKAQGPASLDAPDDVIVEKALQQAAFQAVEQMRARPTITAMVLWTRGDVVFLNVGSRGGLRDGMKMVAVRGGERIGLIEVTDADAIGSYGKIIEGPPLRTGDHLRAIFDLPSVLSARPPEAVRRSKNRIENILLAAAVLLGLGGHASAARLIAEGNTAFPNFVATNLANAAEQGVSGWVSSFWIDGRDLHPTAAGYLTWGSYQGTEGTRLVGVEIWRGGELVDVWLTDRHPEVELIDDLWPPSFVLLDFTFDEVTGALTEYEIDVEVWDPDWELDEETGQWSPNNTWPDFMDDHSDDVDSGDVGEGNQWIYGWFPTYGLDDYCGPFPGLSYQYRLVPLVLEQMHQAPGSYTWDLHRGEATTYTNWVTAITPAFTAATWYGFVGYRLGVYEVWDSFDNPDLDGNLATFYFYDPIGASDIIIQVARYPNYQFAPEATYTEQVMPVSYEYWDPYEIPPDPYNGGAIFTRPLQMRVKDLDLSRVPQPPGSSDTYFLWRIGARDPSDSWPARSWPEDFLNDRGYVWSLIGDFDILTARTADMHQQRDLLGRARAGAARLPRRASSDRVLRAE